MSFFDRFMSHGALGMLWCSWYASQIHLIWRWDRQFHPAFSTWFCFWSQIIYWTCFKWNGGWFFFKPRGLVLACYKTVAFNRIQIYLQLFWV